MEKEHEHEHDEETEKLEFALENWVGCAKDASTLYIFVFFYK